jgi:hypothetical protein
VASVCKSAFRVIFLSFFFFSVTNRSCFPGLIFPRILKTDAGEGLDVTAREQLDHVRRDLDTIASRSFESNPSASAKRRRTGLPEDPAGPSFRVNVTRPPRRAPPRPSAVPSSSDDDGPGPSALVQVVMGSSSSGLGGDTRSPPQDPVDSVDLYAGLEDHPVASGDPAGSSGPSGAPVADVGPGVEGVRRGPRVEFFDEDSGHLVIAEPPVVVEAVAVPPVVAGDMASVGGAGESLSAPVPPLVLGPLEGGSERPLLCSSPLAEVGSSSGPSSTDGSPPPSVSARPPDVSEPLDPSLAGPNADGLVQSVADTTMEEEEADETPAVPEEPKSTSSSPLLCGSQSCDPPAHRLKALGFSLGVDQQDGQSKLRDVLLEREFFRPLCLVLPLFVSPLAFSLLPTSPFFSLQSGRRFWRI